MVDIAEREIKIVSLFATYSCNNCNNCNKKLALWPLFGLLSIHLRRLISPKLELVT